MNNLILKIKKIEHPFPAPNTMWEHWGLLNLILKSPGKKKRLIRNFEWNLEAFVEVYTTMFHGVFYHTNCFFEGKNLFSDHLSLASCYKSYRNKFMIELEREEQGELQADEDPAFIKWEYLTDQISPLRKFHCISRGWSESGFLPIYIGCKNGIGEISLNCDGEVWSYNFDMNAFQEQSYNELVRFMEEGLANNPHLDFQQRNRPILEKLKAIPKHWFGHCGDPVMSAKIFAEGDVKYPRMY